MSTPAFEPSSLPGWQAALTLGPWLAAAAGTALATGPAARAWRIARGASGLALALALAGAAALAASGPAIGAWWRADTAGAAVSLLVAFLGWVVVRYSATYLAGEPNEARAARFLLATLAAVHVVLVTNHLLVLALAWMATGLALHRLLTFHAGRRAAALAAHKKVVLARVADVAMLGACALLASAAGTLRIDQLVASLSAQGLGPAIHVALALVAVAALVRCGQLPFHGWLIQVMEAPTPVSALLHAGVVNLGGFVLWRLAPLVSESAAAVALLVVGGGTTALLAALVASTRVSVKVSLAWSTCAQMGFMLLQCGLGLWAMALLHLLAHSLYKAHAFLSSGGAVAQAVDARSLPAAPAPSFATQAATVVLSMGLVGAVALALGRGAVAQPAAWAMAAVMALAPAALLPPAGRSWLRAALAAVGLGLVYAALHLAAQALFPSGAAAPASLWWLLPLLGFLLLALLQAWLRAHPQGALSRRLHPWFFAGLHLDEPVGRWLFRLWPPRRLPVS